MSQQRFNLARKVSREQGQKILAALLERLKSSPYNDPKYQPKRITEPKKVRI